MQFRRAIGWAAVSLALISTPVTANDTPADADSALYPSCGGVYNLCGYARRSDGFIVIAQTFEGASRFSEGLAAVQLDGLSGYINMAGNIVIAPQFDEAGPFRDGIAEVLVGDHTTVISRSGEQLLPAKFARAIPIGGEMLVAQTGVTEATYGLDPDILYMIEMAGLYNIRLGAITAEVYEFSEFETGRSDLIWARETREDASAKYGLMRSDGTWAVTPRYDYVSELSDGMAVVGIETRKGTVRQNRRGAVDATGTVRVPLEYDNVFYWQDGYGIARRDGKEAFIDRDGRLLGRRFFSAVNRGHERQVQDDGQWYHIADDGTLGPVTPEAPEVPPAVVPGPQRTSHCGAGVNFYTENGSWGLQREDGSVLVPAQFAAISCFEGGVVWVPVEAEHSWCALRPNGQRHRRLKCVPTYHAAYMTHYVPETLDPDPFLSSVKWMQAYLRNAVDPSNNPPPKVVGDGGMGQGTRDAGFHSRWR